MKPNPTRACVRRSLPPFVGWVLVCVYAVGLVQPAMPVLGFWANQDFYATTQCVNRFEPQRAACCQGQCQLQAQLQQQAEENPSETPTLPAPVEQSPQWGGVPGEQVAHPPVAVATRPTGCECAPPAYATPICGLIKPPPQA